MKKIVKITSEYDQPALLLMMNSDQIFNATFITSGLVKQPRITNIVNNMCQLHVESAGVIRIKMAVV